MISISLTRFMFHLRDSSVVNSAIEAPFGSRARSTSDVWFATRSGAEFGVALTIGENVCERSHFGEIRGAELLWDAEEGVHENDFSSGLRNSD